MRSLTKAKIAVPEDPAFSERDVHIRPGDKQGRMAGPKKEEDTQAQAVAIHTNRETVPVVRPTEMTGSHLEPHALNRQTRPVMPGQSPPARKQQTVQVKSEDIEAGDDHEKSRN